LRGLLEFRQHRLQLRAGQVACLIGLGRRVQLRRVGAEQLVQRTEQAGSRVTCLLGLLRSPLLLRLHLGRLLIDARAHAALGARQ
jgi:hypothetical protein